MKKNKQTLLHHNEELLARIEMQDQMIRNFEKEICENVNQILCLARIKLIHFDPGDKGRAAEIVEQSGNLIGQAIHDLRNLAKQVKKL